MIKLLALILTFFISHLGAKEAVDGVAGGSSPAQKFVKVFETLKVEEKLELYQKLTSEKNTEILTKLFKADAESQAQCAVIKRTLIQTRSRLNVMKYALKILEQVSTGLPVGEAQRGSIAEVHKILEKMDSSLYATLPYERVYKLKKKYLKKGVAPIVQNFMRGTTEVRNTYEGVRPELFKLLKRYAE